MEQQLALCHRCDIRLDELEQHALKLLHAKTGAAVARDIFGVKDAVYEAIRWHTTGKPDMTLLEKVIYLADYIEPKSGLSGGGRAAPCGIRRSGQGPPDGPVRHHR